MDVGKSGNRFCAGGKPGQIFRFPVFFSAYCSVLRKGGDKLVKSRRGRGAKQGARKENQVNTASDLII